MFPILRWALLLIRWAVRFGALGVVLLGFYLYFSRQAPFGGFVVDIGLLLGIGGFIVGEFFCFVVERIIIAMESSRKSSPN